MNEIRQENLLLLIDKYSTQEEFAAAIDVTPGYLPQLKSGSRPISEKTARKIEKRLKLPEFWMDKQSYIEGEAIRLDDENAINKTIYKTNAYQTNEPKFIGRKTEPTKLEPIAKKGNGYVLVPMLQLGQICDYITGTLTTTGDTMPCHIQCSEKTFALKIEDDSMFNALAEIRFNYPKDTVLYFDPDIKDYKDRAVIARVKKSGIEFIRVYREEPNGNTLVSTNPSYDKIAIDDGIEILAVAIFRYMPC